MKPGDGNGNHGILNEFDSCIGGGELPLLFDKEATPATPAAPEKTESAVHVKKDKKPIPRHGR